MSWQATAWAINQKTGSTRRKALLLALANYADENGVCWPSQERLARNTEQSMDSIQRHSDALEKSKVLKREPLPKRRGQYAGYRYYLAMHSHHSSEETVQPPFFLMPPFLNSTGFIVLLLGSILAITRSRQMFGTQPVSEGLRSSIQLDPVGYDLKKWQALLHYDADIKRVADALAPYGQRYLDQFAEAFMAINDKNYLPQIIQTILSTAKTDAALVPVEEGSVNYDRKK